jgi:hypothetical protein
MSRSRFSFRSSSEGANNFVVRLFDGATSQVPLKLVDERKLGTGVLYATYAPVSRRRS